MRAEDLLDNADALIASPAVSPAPKGRGMADALLDAADAVPAAAKQPERVPDYSVPNDWMPGDPLPQTKATEPAAQAPAVSEDLQKSIVSSLKGVQMPAALVQKRGPLDAVKGALRAAKDDYVAASSGFYDTAALVPQLADLLTGGKTGFLGDAADWLEGLGEKSRQFGLSEQAQREQQAIGEGLKTADGFTGTAKLLASNPAGAMTMGLQSLPTMAATMLPGGYAGRFAQAAKAAKLAKKPLGALGEAAAKDPEKFVEGVTIAANSLLNGASTYGDAKDEGLSQSQATAASILSALGTAGIGRLTGGGAEAAIAKNLTRTGGSQATADAADSALKRGLTAAGSIAKSGANESFQEYGENLSDVGSRRAIGNEPITQKDVNELHLQSLLAAPLGGLGGVNFHGNTTGLEVYSDKSKEPEAPKAEQPLAAEQTKGQSMADAILEAADRLKPQEKENGAANEQSAAEAETVTQAQSDAAERTAGLLDTMAAAQREKTRAAKEEVDGRTAEDSEALKADEDELAAQMAREQEAEEITAAEPERARAIEEGTGLTGTPAPQAVTEKVRAERPAEAPKPAAQEEVQAAEQGEQEAPASSSDEIAQGENPDGSVRFYSEEKSGETDGVKLQNRDRSTPASINQMNLIAGKPDYARTSISRDFGNGAPVVAYGSVPKAQLGKKGTAVTSSGERIPVQYAVVEADDVLTSNNILGSTNTAYTTAPRSRMRAVAGNGRITGIRAGYERGTAGAYKNEMMADTEGHGIPAEVIGRMKRPVLVRVMPESKVRPGIADESNTSGNLSMSAVETAANDVDRVDFERVNFDDDGNPTPETVRDFVKQMPATEQGALIDTDGQPTRAAVDRFYAAVFKKAYGNDELVRLQVQATDPEVRNVFRTLTAIAGKMARLEGAGDLDIRGIVAKAAMLAVNAKREGVKLADYASQDELFSGDDRLTDDDVQAVVEVFTDNARSAKRMTEILGNAADFAYSEASKPDEDMFGPTERATRADVIAEIRKENHRYDEVKQQQGLFDAEEQRPNEREGRSNLEEPAGAKPAEEDVQRPADRTAADGRGSEDARGAEEERVSGEAADQAAGRTFRYRYRGRYYSADSKRLPKAVQAAKEQGRDEKYRVYDDDDAEAAEPDVKHSDAADHGVKYSVRRGPAPKKTKTVYKLMRIARNADGEIKRDEKGQPLLYPLYIDSSEPIRVGVWQNADSADLSALSRLPSGYHLIARNGRAVSFEDFRSEHPDLSRKADRTHPAPADIRWATAHGARFFHIVDVKGSSATTAQKRYGDSRRYYSVGLNGVGSAYDFALRPGFHAGTLPVMHQIGDTNRQTGKRDIRNDAFVWVQGEVPADIDYQQEADSNAGGDIATHIPEDGYYKFYTNADKSKQNAGVEWVVAGGFKPVRVLSDAEADSAVDAYNAEHKAAVPYDYRRAGGRRFNAETGRLEGASDASTKFSRRGSAEAGMTRADECAERLRRARGGIGIDAGKLEDHGDFVVVDDENALPLRLRRAVSGRADGVVTKESGAGEVQAVYDTRTGKSYIIAANVKPGDEKGIFLHEVGVHMATDRLGKAWMQPLVERAWKIVKIGRKNGDRIASRVYGRLADADLIQKDGELQQGFEDEAYAYLCEEALNNDDTASKPIRKWLDSVVAKVRAWLYRHGLFVTAERLSADDLVQIAKENAHALAKLSESKPAVRGPEVKASRREVKQVDYDPYVDGFDTPHVQGDLFERLDEGNPVWGYPVRKEYHFSDRDALGKRKFGYGEWAYDHLASAAHLLFDKIDKLSGNKFNLNPLPTEFRKMYRRYKADIENSRREIAEVGEAMSGMSEGERTLVSDVIEKMVKPGVTPPEEVVHVAASIQNLFDAQSDELVRLGLITEEQAAQWRGQYLPRVYAQSGELLARAKKDFNKIFGSGAGIGGGRFKDRGIFKQVTGDEALKQNLELGWQLKDPNWRLDANGKAVPVGGEDVDFDGNGPAPAVKVYTLWRDFSPEERLEMGEQRDALLRVVIGYMQSQEDIAKARFFESLAKDTRFATWIPQDGWVKVPDTTIGDGYPVKRFGALAGMYVSPDVWSMLEHVKSDDSQISRIAKALLSAWKEGKTALNPVAHTNNTLGNFVLAGFAGVNILDVRNLYDTIKEMRGHSARFLEAQRAGLFTGSFSKEEMAALIPIDAVKKALINDKTPLEKALDLFLNVGSLGARGGLRKAYEFEDAFFKFLIYRYARSKGMEPADAIDYANSYIFAYDDLPSGARKIRGSILPFFSWTYKAIPMMVKTAMLYPHRVLIPASMCWAFQTAVYVASAAMASAPEDDWEEILKRAVAWERAEDEALPDYAKGLSLYGTPKFLRLWRNSDGTANFLDMSRIMPGGDLMDINNQMGGMPWAQPLMPNSPQIGLFLAILANKDSFTGREIVENTDTAGDAFRKRLGYVYRTIAPSLAPGAYHFNRLANAAVAKAGTPISVYPFFDYTGTDWNGRPIELSRALAHTFGIKVRAEDLQQDAAKKVRKMKSEISDVQGNLRYQSRAAARGAASGSSLDAFAEHTKEQIEQRTKKMSELMDRTAPLFSPEYDKAYAEKKK